MGISSPTPKITDIIKFVVANSEAAEFCMSRGITGKVVEMVNGTLEIDTGFGYFIYANNSDVEVVASQSDVPHPEDLT